MAAPQAYTLLIMLGLWRFEVAKSKNFLPLIMFGALIILNGCVTQSSKDHTKQKPVAPANVEVKTMDQAVEISWAEVPGAVRYTVFWGTDPGDYKGLANSDSCSLILKGLNKGETYRFAVTSWNKNGESRYSEEKIAMVGDQDSSSHFAKNNGERATKSSKRNLN
jgi:hypothetical protein